MRKPARFFSLAKPKLRQSWNKYNMYNIYRYAARDSIIKGQPTFFQQKWAAKSKARAYHGEHIPEKKWVRLFSPRLLSAVDMPPSYLAEHDGSEQAAGRGSGLSNSTVQAKKYSRVPVPRIPDPNIVLPNQLMAQPLHKMTPYMQMTFAPLERRLDTAIFRAMFATSVRQARQFVLHGAVKVNGKKLLHPSYQLNPGDMFQVDIDKVMYATGVQKSKNIYKAVEDGLAKRTRQAEQSRKFLGGSVQNAAPSEGEASAEAAAEEAEATTEQGEDVAPELSEEAQRALQRRELKKMVAEFRQLLKTEGRDLSAMVKRKLRLLRSDAKRLLSLPKDSDINISELMQQLQLVSKDHSVVAEAFLKRVATVETAEKTGKTITEQEYRRERKFLRSLEGLSEEQAARARDIVGDVQLSNAEMNKLKELMQADEENPVDETKPYATPWAPRPFMAAFAFIPRYLEVNHDICAAVYLRHPVAREGRAEVPTPFTYLTNQLAHNWYLQRG